MTNLKTRITFNGKSYPCRVVNLSETGALVETPFHAPVGARADIHMPAGPAKAQVMRVTSTYIALHFAEPMEISATLEASQPLFAGAVAATAV